MNKIRFSHNYVKMPWDTEHTKLLEVLKVNDLKDLHPEFLKYDTSIEGKDESYPLQKNTPLLILLLHSLQDESMSWELWTTVRRWTNDKESYYRSLRGQEVEIVIE